MLRLKVISHVVGIENMKQVSCVVLYGWIISTSFTNMQLPRGSFPLNENSNSPVEPARFIIVSLTAVTQS